MTEKGASETRHVSLILLLIVAIVFLTAGFAGGYALSLVFPYGNLRKPAEDRLYKLKLVAVPRSMPAGGNYEFEEYFPGTDRLMEEVGLRSRTFALDNGSFAEYVKKD